MLLVENLERAMEDIIELADRGIFERVWQTFRSSTLGTTYQLRFGNDERNGLLFRHRNYSAIWQDAAGEALTW